MCHLSLKCNFHALFKCAHPHIPHDHAAKSPRHTCGIIFLHGHVMILIIALSISLAFLTKSGQWRGTSALRSCSTRTSSYLLANTVTVAQHGLDYSEITPLSTSSRTFDIWSLYTHVTLSLKKNNKYKKATKYIEQ